MFYVQFFIRFKYPSLNKPFPPDFRKSSLIRLTPTTPSLYTPTFTQFVFYLCEPTISGMTSPKTFFLE